MGKKSRTKGAAAENDVCAMLRPLYPDVARFLDQYQESCGRDLRGCDPWCVQVKRKKVMTPGDKHKAFEEALSACDDSTWLLPVVFYREDRKRWRALTSLDVLTSWWINNPEIDYNQDLMVDMDADEFIEWMDNAR